MKKMIAACLTLSLLLGMCFQTAFAAENKFTDISSSKYYYNAVLWAVEKGITGGRTSTTFAPDEACTRAQVVTFLYRFAGEPEVQNKTNPFTDVSSSKYYYNAVLWAVENGITSGKTATTFQPDAPCTRAQVVTFLHRFTGEPEPTKTDNPFSDIKSSNYYYKPVLWAVEKGITSGKTATTFQPDATCVRAQVVTFLYRYAGEPALGEDDTEGIKVGSVNAAKGSTVQIPVTITNNPGIIGMALTVTYNENVMTMTSVSKGEAISGVLEMTPSKELNSGCNIIFDSVTVSDENIKDGVIVYLTFTIKSDAAAGSYPVTITASGILNNNVEEVEVPLTNGSVTIK